MISPSRYIKTLIYMLQGVEYKSIAYLRWFWRVDSFSTVMYRKSLDLTPIAKALYMSGMTIMTSLILIGTFSIYRWQTGYGLQCLLGGIAILVITPVLTAHLLTIPVTLGGIFILKPQRRKRFADAEKIFAAHGGFKIGIAGSYGKTTMKELLAAVIGSGKKVAFTPGNLNTAIAHARFAETLDGNEEVLVIEYGEFEPDDVFDFAKMTHPDATVITGLNESHLDTFESIDVTARTIFGAARYLSDKGVYVSGEDKDLKPHTKKPHNVFSRKKVMGWKISKSKIMLTGTSFVMTKSNQTINVQSGLLGAHNIAPLALSAALAEDLGVKISDIEGALEATKPYEHRLQPRNLGGDITILDDTYNGSIDGVRAGLNFLGAVGAKRKMYVTPGLVEQGDMTESNHIEIGEMIAVVVDEVYLIRNSTTEFIIEGLEKKKFKGEIIIVHEPLKFYQNLDTITKSGDVVLMQNDWTDNYV